MLLKYQENTRKNLAYQVYTEYIREIHRCIYSLKLRAKNVFPGFVASIFGIQFVHHYSSLPSSWPYRKHFLMLLQNWLISFLNWSKYIFFSNCISRIYQVYRCISHLSRFFLPVQKYIQSTLIWKCCWKMDFSGNTEYILRIYWRNTQYILSIRVVQYVMVAIFPYPKCN